MAGNADRRSSTRSERVPKDDRLMVRSVEKAFRVLQAFDGTHQSLSLSQISVRTGLDMSAAQRFSHTLTKLGYLVRSEETRRYMLGVKLLEFGFQYTRSNPLIERALPYLLHLSNTVQETVNLTVLDGTDLVFVCRYSSRHVINNDVIVGSRLPAYCTAPGRAILSRMPEDVTTAILKKSDLRSYTPSTTWQLEKLLEKIREAAEKGYSTSFEEYYPGDLSIAAAIVDQNRAPVGAINVAVSASRFTPEEATASFAPLVVSAASAASQDFVTKS